MDRKHIAIVEDVEFQRQVVAEYLRRAGFDVSEADSGQALRKICQERSVDLAIIDLQLPDEDGFDLVRFLRDTQRCGIVVLTANDDPTDRVVGLEVGADDFLLKPHPPRELLARVRSLLRRMFPEHAGEATPAANGAAPAATRESGLGGWTLDVMIRGLRDPQGQEISLTNAEFALMKELAMRPGEVLDRDHLMRAVFHRPWAYEDRSMDVLITRLRRKLEPAARAFRIGSVRGTGYVLSVHAV